MNTNKYTQEIYNASLTIENVEDRALFIDVMSSFTPYTAPNPSDLRDIFYRFIMINEERKGYYQIALDWVAAKCPDFGIKVDEDSVHANMTHSLVMFRAKKCMGAAYGHNLTTQL
jgi:hypothetical protein